MIALKPRAAKGEIIEIDNDGSQNMKQPGSFARTAGLVLNLLFGAILVLMALLAFFLAQSSITGKAPAVFGRQMYIIISESMSPALKPGCLALVDAVRPDSIQEGDIITFYSLPDNQFIAHRVVEIVPGDGLLFITKGDDNRVKDLLPVRAEQLVGRVDGSLPYLGYLMGFAQTRQGLIFTIFIPGLLIIIYEIRRINRYMREGSNSGGSKTGIQSNTP